MYCVETSMYTLIKKNILTFIDTPTPRDNNPITQKGRPGASHKCRQQSLPNLCCAIYANKCGNKNHETTLIQ